MSEEQVRAIIRQELGLLLGRDRYLFQKDVQMFDGRNWQFGRTTGTMLGTATDQKMAFFGVTPVAQQTPAQSTSVASAGAGATIKIDTTFTGGVGSTQATVTDLFTILKAHGILKN